MRAQLTAADTATSRGVGLPHANTSLCRTHTTSHRVFSLAPRSAQAPRGAARSNNPCNRRLAVMPRFSPRTTWPARNPPPLHVSQKIHQKTVPDSACRTS
ncbi:hypothetical protein CVO74_17765 [Xanthomonas prunicola]|uniref:Uncharacterized protein n=1 Tax=Xanthomonas prunicola TaxID=2053930 RepID=A0A2N3REN3_9XANT|nr:hypothetical protein XpruCFBP8353_20735 [Xanthomonas prunicola]PKV15889.1 hypothetical protein XpruCFBP8354_17945 [Xanthomonas prunicola]PKV19958.1 hypothetical protein CVO74_17765 [Xanthomonas prunicola]